MDAAAERDAPQDLGASLPSLCFLVSSFLYLYGIKLNYLKQVASIDDKINLMLRILKYGV